MLPIAVPRDPNVIAGGSVVATLRGLGLMGKNTLVADELKFRFQYDPLHPPYQIAYSTYLAMLDFIRTVYSPRLSHDKVYEIMGRATTDAYFGGTAGSVMKTLMPLVSDQAAANIILKRFKELLPFGQHDVTIEKPGRVLYRKRGVDGPHEFMRGMILAMLEVTRAKNPRVTYTELGQFDVLYCIEWNA